MTDDKLSELEQLRASLTAVSADIDKFWQYVEMGWDIEPRAYFEKEARTNGFDSPLAQAAHHVWKRDPKVAEVSRRLAQAHETLKQIAEAPQEMIAIMREHDYVFRRFPRDMKAQPPEGDGEKWEALAFSLYSKLAESSSQAEATIRDNELALSAPETEEHGAPSRSLRADDPGFT